MSPSGRTIIRFENDKQNLAPNKEAEALANTESDTEQVRKSESEVRKSESDTPTGEVRASEPHRTHQVYALFFGFYASMFYRVWVVMGFIRYFHTFLGK